MIMKYTHLGLKEYRISPTEVTDILYDGHFDPVFKGLEKDVLKYLKGLLYLGSDEFENLSWEGPNGWFYQGKSAKTRILAEITKIEHGLED